MSLKQSPVGSRGKSSKGFKVKHVMQGFLLLVISLWLIYQLKHSYDKKAAAAAALTHGLPSEDAEAEQEAMFRLGRKDLLRPIGRTGERMGGSGGKGKGEMDELEAEEVITSEEEEGRGGGGEDEVEGPDQERSEEEEAEDLIDVEDRENGKGNNESEDNTSSLGNDENGGDDDDDDELKAGA